MKRAPFVVSAKSQAVLLGFKLINVQVVEGVEPICRPSVLMA